MSTSPQFTMFRKIFSMRSVLGALLSCFMVSCATHPDMTPTEVAVVKNHTPPKGQGFVYVYRPRVLLAGRAIPRSVIVNGQNLGSNTNGTYMAIPLKQGAYKVNAAYSPYSEDPHPKYRAYWPISLNVKAGECYFIRQDLKEGGVRHSETIMMATPGGGFMPMDMGSGDSPFIAIQVPAEVGKMECQSLKLVGADPYN